MTGEQSESGTVQILLAGLSARAVSRAELLAWADALMVRTEGGPPSWLIDLSLSRTDDDAIRALRVGSGESPGPDPMVELYLLTEAARLGRLTTVRAIESAFHVVIYDDVPPPVSDLVYELDDKLERALRDGHDASQLAAKVGELRAVLLDRSEDARAAQAVVERCRNGSHDSQADGFAITFDEPSDGWLGFRIEAAGCVLEDSFSCTPSDTVTEFAEAVDAVVSHSGDRSVILHLEPVEIELQFGRRDAELVSIRGVQHRDRSRASAGEHLFTVAIPITVLGTTVWRALRSLSSRLTAEQYELAWRHPFPDRLVAQLGVHARQDR